VRAGPAAGTMAIFVCSRRITCGCRRRWAAGLLLLVIVAFAPRA